MQIIFPQYNNQRYWNIHFLYVLNIFKYLNWDIKYEEREDFRVTINRKDFLFDYSDDCKLIPKTDLPIFKFHCIKETEQIYAFPPVSFYNWDEYYQLEKEIKYNPSNSILISCRQRPYGNATERRIKVQSLLKEHNFSVLTTPIPQIDYWVEINNIRVAVFVPGYSENILDRGQFQYLSLGCCTISPIIFEKLPFNCTFIPGFDYICAKDYEHLVSILYSNTDNIFIAYKQIGINAKKTFELSSTPELIGKWIESKL